MIKEQQNKIMNLVGLQLQIATQYQQIQNIQSAINNSCPSRQLIVDSDVLADFISCQKKYLLYLEQIQDILSARLTQIKFGIDEIIKGEIHGQ